MLNSTNSSPNINATSVTAMSNKRLNLSPVVFEVLRYIRVIQVLVGSVGNIVALGVLHRKAFRRSTSAVYLRTIAVLDSAILVCIIFAAESNIVCENEIACYTYDYLASVVSDTSIWVLVLFSAERLISVMRPYDVKRILSVRRSVIATVVTMLAFLVINSHDLWLMNRNRCFMCVMFYAEGDIFKEIISHLDVVKKIIVPVPFMAISSIIIIIQVHRQKKKRERYINAEFTGKTRRNVNQEDQHSTVFVVPGSSPQGQRSTQDMVIDAKHTPYGRVKTAITGRTQRKDSQDKGMILTLIALNVLFIVTRVTQQIYKFIKLNDRSPEAFFGKGVLFTFVMFNQTLNVFLYAWSGSKFRRELVAMMKDARRLCRAP